MHHPLSRLSNCTFIRFGLIPGDYDPTSLIWTEWLYPFCVYGVGAVFCVLLFFPVKNFLLKHFNGIVSLVLSFVISGVVCSLIELTMGLVLNQPNAEGVYPLWDYSTMFCNFMGQICLQNGLAFGLAATLMTWVIYPVAEQLLRRLSSSTMMVVFIVTTVLFCVLFFFYCINIVIPDYADNAELDSSEACVVDVGEAGMRDGGALDSSSAFAWDARTSGGSETYTWSADAPGGSEALLAAAL